MDGLRLLKLFVRKVSLTVSTVFGLGVDSLFSTSSLLLIKLLFLNSKTGAADPEMIERVPISVTLSDNH